jgi:P pilus assembly chaperone PapD
MRRLRMIGNILRSIFSKEGFNRDSYYEFLLSVIEDNNYNNVSKLRELVSSVKMFADDKEKALNLVLLLIEKIEKEVKSKDEQLRLINKLAKVFYRPKKVELKQKKKIEINYNE